MRASGSEVREEGVIERRGHRLSRLRFLPNIHAVRKLDRPTYHVSSRKVGKWYIVRCFFPIEGSAFDKAKPCFFPGTYQEQTDYVQLECGAYRCLMSRRYHSIMCCITLLISLPLREKKTRAKTKKYHTQLRRWLTASQPISQPQYP